MPGQNGIGSESVTNKPSTPIEEKGRELTPTSDGEAPPKIESENSKSGSSGEDETSCDSGYIPKTPSTAERRKLFEKSNSKENEPEDGFDIMDQGNFERASLQRTSIAERRKMYESRSMSVQDTVSITAVEKKDGSPVMLRRKDSLKNRRNADEVLKDDNNRRSVPISKQQSLDPLASRKSEIATPTPKRTSTVFGKNYYIEI